MIETTSDIPVTTSAWPGTRRPETQMRETIFGLNCVHAALTANRRQIYKLLIYQNDLKTTGSSHKLQDVLEAAQKRKVAIQFTTRKELDTLLEDRPHQNVALEVSKFEPPVIASPPASVNGILLFPVNLLDPQNLGSIIRSAAFYGCAGLVTSLKHSCDFTPIVSKASAGSMELFDGLFRTKSPLQFIKNAKEAGFRIIGTGLSHSDTHNSRSDTSRVLLLMGNEGNGLSPEVLALCDENLVISPQFNDCASHLDSLNVGVAAGILLDRLRNKL